MRSESPDRPACWYPKVGKRNHLREVVSLKVTFLPVKIKITCTDIQYRGYTYSLAPREKSLWLLNLESESGKGVKSRTLNLKWHV